MMMMMDDTDTDTSYVLLTFPGSIPEFEYVLSSHYKGSSVID